LAKILVIENEASYCESLEMIFRKAGHKVRLAGTSREALRHVKDFRPDIVVTDWMLENHYHGGELSEKIRRVLPEARFIVITGFLEVVDLVKNSYDYIEEVISKPFRTAEILQAVERIVP